MPQTTTSSNYLCKSPAERRYYSMDFSALMADAETITSIISVESEQRGGGVSDLAIDDTGIGSDNRSVEMYIASGTDFQTYRIEVLVDTSLQRLQGDGLLKITDK